LLESIGGATLITETLYGPQASLHAFIKCWCIPYLKGITIIEDDPANAYYWV